MHVHRDTHFYHNKSNYFYFLQMIKKPNDDNPEPSKILFINLIYMRFFFSLVLISDLIITFLNFSTFLKITLIVLFCFLILSITSDK